MKIKNHAPMASTRINYKKGEISSNRLEGVRIWQRDADRIYVTCLQCSTIADISDHKFDKSGAVSPCVICKNCRTHYFPVLLGWNGSYSIVCGECYKIGFFNPGEKEVGWRRSKASCECCEAVMCPACLRRKRK